jgi:nucleoside-diphosphate-sugar epimerase
VIVATTGTTGFVGRQLAAALARAGFEVRCLARSRARAAGLPTECRVVEGDLFDRPALTSLLSGAEVVIHAAGLVMARNEAEFFTVNRDGTRTLALAAREAGVSRFVHVSSLAASGPASPTAPADENSPPRPVTPYGRSKLAGEEALRAEGIPFTILRPPAVYGPGDRAFLRLFRLARLGFAPVLGDGQQILSLVHVADLVRALLTVATAAGVDGRLYHAAGPELVTQRDLVQAIGCAVGRSVRVLAIPAPLARGLLHLTGALARLARRPTQLAANRAGEYLAPAWTCSSAALERDTGWRAQVPLERGLTETATWYRQEGWLS